MGMMIVRHKVKDYDAWRPVFDADMKAQEAAGLTRPRVLRSADDPNELVILFDDMETAAAKEFAASDELKQKMMAAGVIDQPTIYFLENT